MVRSETVFDADWDDDDLQAALAWKAEADLRCSGCGEPRDESMSPDRALAYEAEPLACHACAARERAARVFRDGNGDTDGVSWRIFEREGVSG